MADEDRYSDADTASAWRLWRFAGVEFDEGRRLLKVDGAAVEIEAKPLDLLVQLLIHVGEVVTKEELLEAVWPGLYVVEGSLTTAVSKLRKALGDERQAIIVTVPRIGYRLGVEVKASRGRRAARAAFGLKAGDKAPGREQWRLARLLDSTDVSEVWLAEHDKTHEARVFKFAVDADRLTSLKREVALARLLRETLGERGDFVRVLEWNFEISPFFIESEYGGLNLAQWAESQGGLAAVPLTLRLALMTNIARAVAAAHSVGVLHKDIKPANVLVGHREGGWRIQVADFGSGGLLEPARLSALRITDPGFADPAGDEPPQGTPLYYAPELLAGGVQTVASDIYALGVMLYQVIVGDVRRPLAAGWEAEIADPLLRRDVAAAAAGDPARRLNSAADLAERLETLEQRRIEVEHLAAMEARAREVEAKLARARMRRPWLVGLVTALVAGTAISGGSYLQARHERDEARRQKALAEAVGQFLSVDLLSRSDPFKNGKPDETLVGAIQAASPDIDRRFRGEPAVAARLHETIARALDQRSAYPEARAEYQRAEALFERVGGHRSQDAIMVDLQLANMEAHSFQGGSMERAKALLAAREPDIAALAHPRPDLPVWLATTRGMIALIGDDAKGAAEQFGKAVEGSRSLPQFDDGTRLAMKQRLAFADFRMGESAKAEALFRELIAEHTRLDGPDAPPTLRVRLNLAQALMAQGRHAATVAETTAIYPRFVEKLGADHELTLQVLATRGQSEGSLERWDAAIADEAALHAAAVRKQGPQSFFAVASLTDAATAECRGGHAAEGLAHARAAHAAAMAGYGPGAALTQGTAFTVGDCLIAAGQARAAKPWLDGVDVALVANLAADPNWGANLALARGQVALAMGRPDEARTYLAAASSLTDSYQKRAVERLRQALDRPAATQQARL
jgi:DNA-binding winged helix-turn-helix (wHTH) protein